MLKQGLLLTVMACVGLRCGAQGFLDPTRGMAVPAVSTHRPLPEQYIWTQDGRTPADAETQPRFFRAAFDVKGVPAEATLYLAGPRTATVWLNGVKVDQVSTDLSAPVFDFRTFAFPVGKMLKAGRNVLAIEAVRGKGGAKFTVMPATIQQAMGKILVAKILPVAPWVSSEAAPLLISDASWKATPETSGEWQRADYDDSAWKQVQSLGRIESSIQFLQANADAGLYNWPGYEGISPFLRQTLLPATAVLRVFPGQGTVANADALGKPGVSPLTVTLPAASVALPDAPSVVFDFGRETVGRLQIVSATGTPVQVAIEYGESETELLNQPFLGTAVLTVPANGTAYGPKSAFRYARIQFLAAQEPVRLSSVQLRAIFYPVIYAGSFESSDAVLNQVWETGAYTAHLCMQDDIWDAPKRDRGRWAGDLDVSGRVIGDVFADHFLMEETLTTLVDDRLPKTHVNVIPGYSALWISALHGYYLRTGSLDYLKTMHERLLSLLATMDAEMDESHLFADRSKEWEFVDWSPDLHSDTPDARRGTQFEYILAYRDAAFLLRELGDNDAAATQSKMADQMTAAAQSKMLDKGTGTFGTRWQVNAMAVLSDGATAAQYPALWSGVLAHTADDSFRDPPITPFYNYYVLAAMAKTGHRAEALDWIRRYWGGMLKEGATSTWEAYDTHWPTKDAHQSLQADDRSGYFVSLAHGWSAGPTAWLMEEVLGVKATAAGYAKATLRPDLAGLGWARGAVPTPRGAIEVDLKPEKTVVKVPEGVELSVLVPVTAGQRTVLVNGTAATGVSYAENGSRAMVILSKAGSYTVETR